MSQRCFNGAALCSARKLGATIPRRACSWSFNGAALCSARKLHPTERQRNGHPVSTEPRCVQRGNGTESGGEGGTDTGFNGAALCSARKRGVVDDIVAAHLFASTEPRCVQRGNQGRWQGRADARRASTEPRCVQRGNRVLEGPVLDQLSLQRSRAVFSAETRASAPAQTPCTCFNGAALCSARKRTRCAFRVLPATRLQRSRAVFSAETQRARRGANVPEMLQRSRAVFSAETSEIGRRFPTPSCFNGAALCSARKRTQEFGGTVMDGPASTEPRCVQRGNYNCRRHDENNHTASTEPRCVQRGNSEAVVEQHHGAEASTEPRCVQRGNGSIHRAPIVTSSRFNGAALCSARKRSDDESNHRHSEVLQRSRAVFSAETTYSTEVLPSPQASTEPRCVQRGNGAGIVDPKVVVLASTEPRCVQRGNAEDHIIKLAILWLQRSRAVFSAETHTMNATMRTFLLASTEPRCVQRGNAADEVDRGRAVAASTEPRCVQRGNAADEVDRGRAVAASTEPRCVQRGN